MSESLGHDRRELSKRKARLVPRPLRPSLAWLIGVVGCGPHGDAPAPVAPPPPRDASVDAPAPPVGGFGCDEPCLFLRDTPLDHLAETYAQRCGKPLVPNNKDCSLLDYERNCIYAAHGMRFRKPKWGAYATRPWYHLRPEFRSKELSQLERDNVHELRLRAHTCRANDVHVSTADYARIQGWFVGYAKGAPTLPAIALSGEDRVEPEELGHTLGTLALRLEKDTWMAYHDPEHAVVVALAGAKLRDVIVDLSPRGADCDDDSCLGPYVHFVFDGRDTLVALVLTDH